jgi:hypothetical protein
MRLQQIVVNSTVERLETKNTIVVKWSTMRRGCQIVEIETRKAMDLKEKVGMRLLE